MESGVDKRVAIVTGSTSGIGRGVAELLLSRGWRVVVNSLSDDEVGESMAALALLPKKSSTAADSASLSGPNL